MLLSHFSGRRFLSHHRLRLNHHVGKRRWAHDQATTDASTKKSRGTSVAEAGITAMLIGIAINTGMQHYRTQRLAELNYVTSLEQRETHELLQTMERTGLTGRKSHSVKEELNDIRQWHIDHNYKGGLVLRDVTQPLFQANPDRGMLEDLEDFALDPWMLARRECYYLYYEITGTGEIKQQIFCRGTTLAIDILTCLSFWMTYDEELDCRVHLGFRNQAERILQDIQPLLAPASDQRGTIEVSGHSLGGAVAYIVAAKLQKRGYRVTRVTSVGAPRFCATLKGAELVESTLPKDTLRIENDADLIPFLPLFGHNVGNKLYLIHKSGKVAYIPAIKHDDDSQSWVDSTIVNFYCRIHEIVLALNRPHRMPPYIQHIKQVFSDEDDNR
jgi:hypothetical protein